MPVANAIKKMLQEILYSSEVIKVPEDKGRAIAVVGL